MWKANKDPQKHKYRVNGYRVLLTRARQGIVVYVPRPDRSHSSRLHDQLDATAQFLILCGMEELTSPSVHIDRKSTRLNSSHGYISYAVFCLKKKKNIYNSRHPPFSNFPFYLDPNPDSVGSQRPPP